MDKLYWEEVWRQERLDFHQQQINPHLQRFWHHMELKPDARVLVPLCGKSDDMHWLLAQGHGVIGVDLSHKAQQAFLASRSEPVRYATTEHLNLAYQGRLLFAAGNIFALTPDILRQVDAVYDRAALVALPGAMRQNYAFFMAQWIKPGGKMLLITRCASQEIPLTPPFNVTEDEVDALYACNFHIECLCEEVSARGVTHQVFLLIRKQPLASGILPAELGESQHS